MNILQQLLNNIKETSVNVTNKFSWSNYTSVINRRELMFQYTHWTKRAISIKTNTIASNPPKLLQEVKGEDKVQTIESDPLIKDFMHFNPKQSYAEARKLVHIYKYLLGVGFILIVPSETAGYKREFYILDPLRVEYNTVDKWGFPTSYKYTQTEGDDVVIPAEFVITFKNPDPEDQTSGSSDVQTSSYAHNSYSSAMNLNMNYFLNMARPESIIVFEGANPQQIAAFEKQYNSKFRGTKKAGKVAFLNKKPEMIELTKSLQDMQFTEGIKLMREEILAHHGVPATMALGTGTYQNAREAQRVFQLNTIQPELDAEADVLNEQLIPAYYSVVPKAYRFVAANAVESDKEMDSRIAKNMADIEAKVPDTFTRNEIREKLDLPAIEGGDEFPEKEEQKLIVQARRFDEDKYVQDLEEELDRSIVKLEAVITEFLEKQESRVLVDFEEFDVLNESYRLQRVLVEPMLDEAAKYEQIYLRHRGILRQDLPIGTPDWIVSYLLETSLEINSTTAKDIQQIVSKGIVEGLTSKEIKDQIVEKYSQYRTPHTGSFSRIDMISRTLSGTIRGNMTNLMLRMDRTVEEHKWRSASDQDTREAHRAANEQVKPIDQPFEVWGEQLMYPGDPAGSAKNIINCRCVEVPV